MIYICGLNSDQQQIKNKDEKYSKKLLFGEQDSECKYNIFFKAPNENSFCLLCKIYAIKMLKFN